MCLVMSVSGGIISYILSFVEAYNQVSSQTDFLTFLWQDNFHSKLLLQIAVRIPVNIADRFICTFAAWGVFRVGEGFCIFLENYRFYFGKVINIIFIKTTCRFCLLCVLYILQGIFCNLWRLASDFSWMKEDVCDRIRKSNACCCNYRICYRLAHFPGKIGLEHKKARPHKPPTSDGLLINNSLRGRSLSCLVSPSIFIIYTNIECSSNFLMTDIHRETVSAAFYKYFPSS